MYQKKSQSGFENSLNAVLKDMKIYKRNNYNEKYVYVILFTIFFPSVILSMKVSWYFKTAENTERMKTNTTLTPKEIFV